MNYTYLITLLNDKTEEYTSIVAKSEQEMKLILSRKSEEYVVTSIQNLGMTISANDFFEQLNDDMNFGGH